MVVQTIGACTTSSRTQCGRQTGRRRVSWPVGLSPLGKRRPSRGHETNSAQARTGLESTSRPSWPTGLECTRRGSASIISTRSGSTPGPTCCWRASFRRRSTSAWPGGRRFTKGLRYNLANDRPLASVVLSDTAPTPVALYLVPPSASDGHRAALDELIRTSELTPWVWKTGEQSMPPLPPCEAVATDSPLRSAA